MCMHKQQVLTCILYLYTSVYLCVAAWERSTAYVDGKQFKCRYTSCSYGRNTWYCLHNTSNCNWCEKALMQRMNASIYYAKPYIRYTHLYAPTCNSLHTYFQTIAHTYDACASLLLVSFTGTYSVFDVMLVY